MGQVDSRKLAAALSSGGLSLLNVGAEVLLYLPADFVREYEDLWMRAHGTEILGKAEEIRVRSRRIDARTKSNGEETMAPAKVEHKRKSRVLLGDEKALATKQRVDRKLRRLARDIKSGGMDGVRRCTKCKKWAEPDWVFCPFDGAATEDV